MLKNNRVYRGWASRNVSDSPLTRGSSQRRRHDRVLAALQSCVLVAVSLVSISVGGGTPERADA
ncbi:MAG: hypothetical protein ACRCSP_01325, partial [Rhodoglobus sp.]